MSTVGALSDMFKFKSQESSRYYYNRDTKFRSENLDQIILSVKFELLIIDETERANLQAL